MDQLLLPQLTRLETALTTLTDSIAEYNPSIPATHALLAAEDDLLQRGLEQLHTHQANQLRMQRLRHVIDAQNARIGAHLASLADARADLLSIPPTPTTTTASVPGKAGRRRRRDVECRELLEYARYIGQYTGFRPVEPGGGGVAGEEEGKGEGMGGAQQQEQEQEQEQEQQQSGWGESKVLEDILRNEKQYLDASTGIRFTPWPSEDVIKRGALARIQGMRERGEDVEGGGGSSGDNRMEVEEGGGDVEQGKQGVKSTATKLMGEGASARRKEEAPKVFGGLDLYDPDED